MKILKQTSTELTVGKKPPYLFSMGLAWAGMLLVALLFCFFVLDTFINEQKLTCHRPTAQTDLSHISSEFDSITCALVELDWRGAERSKTLFSGLQEAKMKTYTVTSSDDSDRTYQRHEVFLLTDTGEIPFDSSINESAEQSIASKINTFIKNSSEISFALVAAHGFTKPLLLIFTGLFFLFGIYGFLGIIKAPPELSCIFDTTLNQMTFKYSEENLLQYPLDDITDILVENWEDTYRVNVILVSGESLPLTYIYNSGRKAKQQIADCIREFLSLR